MFASSLISLGAPSLVSEGSRSNDRFSLKSAAILVAALLMIVVYSKWQISLTDSTNEINRQPQHGESILHSTRSPSLNTDIIQGIDCDYLEAVRLHIAETRVALSKSWNVPNYPNFLTMMHIPDLSWDLQKAKFVKLLLEANNNHVVSTRFDDTGNSTTKFIDILNVSFVAGFSGSSVTAGHGTKLLLQESVKLLSMYCVLCVM